MEGPEILETVEIIQKEKKYLYDFWNEKSCGEDLYLTSISRKAFEEQATERYRLEPYIPKFADFNGYKNKKVLEIGLGLGADHQLFAEGGALLFGIDLTERSIDFVKKRLKIFRLKSNIEIGDAEKMTFEKASFDLVYSWGVIHHSPNTQAAINEIYRVLKKGAIAKVMIYHKWSFVGFMLWIRYGLLRGNPLLSLDNVYKNYLESYGTKAYSIKEARHLFSKFDKVNIRTVLSHGDLLSSSAGQRHRGFFLTVAKVFWPRRVIEYFFPRLGLFMMIEAKK